MTEILIDTNLLVYTCDLREKEKRAHAIAVLRALEDNNLGCLSVQCLSEFFSLTTRGKTPKLTIEEASQRAEELLNAFPIFPLTSTIVLEAMRGVREHMLSYYDAQIWACAHLNQVPVIFSEDFSDGQTLEGVRFANPFGKAFELEKWL